MKIAIIDYEIGNVKSIINAFIKIGIEPILTNDREAILSSDGLILPGVGAFAHGMENLKRYGLEDIIYEFVNTQKPFMGICLGMQMLMEESEEFGITKGLGLIEGKVIKLPVQNPNYEKLPHVSWNEISTKNINWENTILDDIEEHTDMYFVHSFVASPKNDENILSTTKYSDYKFCSSVKKDNIYGCQFHPEKSGEKGLKIMQNFVNLCKEKKMSEKLEAYYGLPSEVKFCKKCVISNQRPSSTVEFKSEKGEKKKVINFNEEDVCSACVYHKEKETNIDWKERDEKLRELLAKFRSKDGSYDVIVPGSGGKDSAYTSHILKYKYGMNPLTVTWAPHLYTDIGWKNFQNWMHVGGHDNILYTPNGKLHREMTKNAFHNLLHPFQPFIVGQRIIGPAMAKKFGVQLVMYGENQAEYGNAIEENTNPIMNMDFFSNDNALEMKFGGVTMQEYIDSGKYTKDDFAPYIAPNKQELIDAGVEVHYLGYYLKWDPQECYYYAADNTGFEANTVRTEGSYSKYSSIDDKIDPFHYFTTLIKFGIGRATYDAAQEVRNGKITREEAAYLVKKYDTEFPAKYFKEFLEYIDSTEKEFWETVNKHRSPHIWKEVDGEWKLRHTVNKDGIDD